MERLLIDANELIDFINSEIDISESEKAYAKSRDETHHVAHNTGEILEALRIKRRIFACKPLDIVSVVRCEECKHSCRSWYDETGSRRPWCEYWDRFTRPDGFCHAGAKMNSMEDENATD